MAEKTLFAVSGQNALNSTNTSIRPAAPMNTGGFRRTRTLFRSEEVSEVIRVMMVTHNASPSSLTKRSAPRGHAVTVDSRGGLPRRCARHQLSTAQDQP